MSTVILDDERVVLDLPDEQPCCEKPSGCDNPAAARFVVKCSCRTRGRLGCEPCIESTRSWAEQYADRLRCYHCHQHIDDWWVVPL